MSHDIDTAAAGVLPDPNPAWEQYAAPVDAPATPPAEDAPAVPAGAHIMPSGNWVQLADPHSLTRGDKKQLILAVKPAETPAEIGFALAEVLLTKLVVAWSYPLPLPSQDASALDRVPGGDDEAISNLIEPAKALLFPSLVTPDDHADPASPTAPSGA